MPTRHYHQNNFATNVTSNQIAGVTTTPLDSIPSVSAPFYIALDATNANSHYEVVEVTSKTATNINHAATTYAHSTDEEVRMVIPAEEMDDISEALATGSSGADGWTTVADTWTYASANTITVPAGAASLYQKGDRIKFTQTTAKYGVITAVADTLLTIAVNTDYVVANAAITSPYYSHQSNPVGFPSWFAYTPTGPTNTTLTGRFTVHGRSCTAVIRGSATGAVDWTNKPTLPITSSSNIMGVGTYFPYMRGGYLDTGTSNNPNSAFGIFADGATTVTIYTSAAAAWSATVPITWANGDVWEIVGTYEI